MGVEEGGNPTDQAFGESAPHLSGRGGGDLLPPVGGPVEDARALGGGRQVVEGADDAAELLQERDLLLRGEHGPDVCEGAARETGHEKIGQAQGLAVGPFLGLAVGTFLGLAEGPFLGLAVGAFLGLAVGPFLGLAVGAHLDLATGQDRGRGQGREAASSKQSPSRSRSARCRGATTLITASSSRDMTTAEPVGKGVTSRTFRPWTAATWRTSPSQRGRSQRDAYQACSDATSSSTPFTASGGARIIPVRSTDPGSRRLPW